MGSRRKTRPRDYLAAAASSRGLYRTLIEDALGLLAPADPKRTDLEPIETFLTIDAMAERLGVSRSTVQGDLRRLENFRWVGTTRPRLLGHREGATLHLVADDAAEDATDEKTLITRYVLADIFAPKDAPAPTTPDEPSGRGLARRWRSD